MSTGPLKSPQEVFVEVLSTMTGAELDALAAENGLPPNQDRPVQRKALLKYVLADGGEPAAPFDMEATRGRLNALTTAQLVSTAELFGRAARGKSRGQLLNDLVNYFKPPK